MLTWNSFTFKGEEWWTARITDDIMYDATPKDGKYEATKYIITRGDNPNMKWDESPVLFDNQELAKEACEQHYICGKWDKNV